MSEEKKERKPDPRVVKFYDELSKKINRPSVEGPEGILFDFCMGPRMFFPDNGKSYVAKVIDTVSGLVIATFDSDKTRAFLFKIKYCFPARILIYHKGEEHPFYVHDFDPRNKTVVVITCIKALGDIIGLFSYVEPFQKKYGCHVTMMLEQKFIDIFQKQHPEISFMTMDQTELFPEKPYAIYQLAPFFSDGLASTREDSRMIGNHRVAGAILNVDLEECPPRVDLTAKRRIKEPYVVIAQYASGLGKLWYYKNGWNQVIAFLHQAGYKVVCCDLCGLQTVKYDNQATDVDIDETGDKPLQERIDLIKDADFFIGLSSGLSWLAWTTHVPIVLISGFTNPVLEFKTPYRVINNMVCNSCWNDLRHPFDPLDPCRCPRHKGTPRMLECSRCITSKMVIDAIKRIPAYQKQAEKYRSQVIIPSMVN